ncbi:hypothetical protein [Bacillus wiedmannii]|uniref:hypothetical protein n=1 Tax=Bacillus wiedmannii TaxID=1890302 RepID=UPI0034D547F8
MMIKHLGANIREKTDGLKLTRNNYIKVSNESSFVKGKIYSDSSINKHIANCLFNYDLNMEYFCSLSKQDFNNELMRFTNTNNLFEEVTDLTPLSMISGYYIMVLDEYNQAYIGRSRKIKERILGHWRKQMKFDRLIFGKKEDSIISIDSFRAYDTTRIFVYQTDEIEEHEDDFINSFDKKFILNRTSGGTLSGLNEAILNRKTR